MDEIDLKPLGIGASRTYKITISSGLDVSGDKFYLTIKKDAEDDDANAVCQVFVVAPNDANSQAGIVFLKVQSSDTLGTDPGNYCYDVLWIKTVTDPGNREPIQRGEIYLYQLVTGATT